MTKLKYAAFAAIIAVGSFNIFYISRPLSAPMPTQVYLEQLTWVEVRAALQGGKTLAIVPTGGVEQNGPHVILGKHNYVVHHTAGEIARALGNALVAPVVTYVPEGEAAPPEGHMRFPGTLSVPEPVFAAILEHTARSLKAHGFKTIAFIGDSGGNQAMQADVAARLDAAWGADGVRVLHISDYYSANGQVDWLLAQGEAPNDIGTHAGIRDTSELMAVYPDGVRPDRMARHGGRFGEETGVIGDPRLASTEYGEKMLSLKINAAVAQLRALLPPAPGS